MTTNQIKKNRPLVNLIADSRSCRAASPFPAQAAFLIFLLFIIAPAESSQMIDNKMAVLAIIGEAENQGDRGMLAVACAIRNRGTLKGVYGFKSPRVVGKKYSMKTYESAVKAWERSQNVDITGGATHWENVLAFGYPYWVKDCTETFRYKDHVFYKKTKKGVS
jgi:spore germination cell wall hydrolase CwlJ-like protein